MGSSYLWFNRHWANYFLFNLSPTNSAPSNSSVPFLPPKGRSSAPWVLLKKQKLFPSLHTNFFSLIPDSVILQCGEERSRTLTKFIINCHLNPRILTQIRHFLLHIRNLEGIFFFFFYHGCSAYRPQSRRALRSMLNFKHERAEVKCVLKCFLCIPCQHQDRVWVLQ